MILPGRVGFKMPESPIVFHPMEWAAAPCVTLRWNPSCLQKRNQNPIYAYANQFDTAIITLWRVLKDALFQQAKVLSG